MIVCAAPMETLEVTLEHQLVHPSLSVMTLSMMATDADHLEVVAFNCNMRLTRNTSL